MSGKRLLLIILVALTLAVVVFPSLGYSGEAANSDMINTIHGKITTAASGWTDRLREVGTRLFWYLVLISLIWTFGAHAFSGSFNIGTVLYEFIKFSVFVGFWKFSLDYGFNVNNDIIKSFFQLGAGTGGEVNASSVLSKGFDIYYIVMMKAGEAGWADYLIMMFLALFILVVVAVVAANLLVMICASTVLCYAGIFYFGFGGSRWTSYIAVNYYKTGRCFHNTFPSCRHACPGSNQRNFLVAQRRQLDSYASRCHAFHFFRTALRVKSYLNCSRIGMPIASLIGDGELTDLGNLDRDAFVECYNRHRGELLGLKIRLTPNICPHDPLVALDKALAIAEELGVPIVLHPNQARTTTEEIVKRMRPGDAYTHTYHNSHTGILDDNGRVKQCVLDARKRGVVFDTGHGANSMSFPVLIKALEPGFLPDTISTDLHNGNVAGPVFDMATTLSKFLCLAIPLHEVFRLALHNPVRLFGLSDKATILAEGARADISAFELSEGGYVYRDAENNALPGRYRLAAKFTVLGDRLYMA